MAQDTRLGTTLAGYRIERLIGRGGMGRVYLAQDARLGRKVALKLLDPELAEDERFRQRFSKESRLAASLDHPNVIPIYEAGESGGVLFIAMRYVEGTDLETLIQAEGPLPLDRATKITSQVASALDAAHEAGLIHRDVKPGNVLVGRADHAYLTDFGLIKRREESTGITKTGAFMGSVNYAAPEQIKGEQVDHRADVYSLGCLLYECLSGEVPFPNDAEVAVLYAHLNHPVPSLRAKRPELAPAVDPIIKRATAKRPEDRYQTAGELGKAVQSISAPTLPSTAPPPRLPARRTIAAALAAIAVAAGAFLLFRGSGHPAGNPQTSPRPSASPIPLGSAVEIDPTSHRILRVAADRAPGAAFIPTPGLAIGEGSVWVLGSVGLARINADSGVLDKVIAPVPLPLTALGSVSVGYRTVWLASGAGVVRVDPASGEVLKPVSVSGTSSLAAGAGGVWALGSTPEGAVVVRIQPTSASVVKRIPVGGSPEGLVAGAGSVWIIDKTNGVVSRIDPATNKVAQISVNGSVDEIGAGNGGVWILDRFAGTVTPIDLSSNRLGGPIPIGSESSSIAVGLGAVWVTDYGGTLHRVSPETRAVSEIHVGAPLSNVAVDEQHGVVWVTVSKSPVGA